MAVTIYDIAAAAQVSAKTVSRVLNDEPNVSAKTRAQVRAAMDALGFKPSIAARSLRGSSSRLIVVLADTQLTLEHLRSAHSSFFDRFQLGAMLACKEAGFHLLVELVDFGHANTRTQVHKLVTALRPDGMILTPPSGDDPSTLDLLDEAGVPYVRIGPSSQLDRGVRVVMDDRAAAAEMTDHLLRLGHRHIAFVTGERRHAATAPRLAGFRDALSKAGVSAPAEWVLEGDFTFESGVNAGTRLLKSALRPTAIFASNDPMALGVLHSAADLGLSVPGELSVAGFDDHASAPLSIPPLTTIRVPVAEMSSAAASILIDGALGDTAMRQQPASLPFTLVVRRSTGAPPALAKTTPARKARAAAVANSGP